jgi:phage tail sheath gpL-like
LTLTTRKGIGSAVGVPRSRNKLLLGVEGRKFLTASLEHQAEVVRLAAAAALFATGSVAARRVLEALAAAHSSNAMSAQNNLGTYGKQKPPGPSSVVSDPSDA